MRSPLRTAAHSPAVLSAILLALVGCSGIAGSATAGGDAGRGGAAIDSGTPTASFTDGSAPLDDAGVLDDAALPPTDAAVDAGSAGDASAASSRKLVGGYYPNWTPSPVRIRDIDPHYNVVYLFAATPVGGTPGTTGAIEWMAPGDGLGAATNLKADLAEARTSQGRKILLSVGGAGNSISFPARSKSQTFVTSVAALYTQLGGFDGLDWDSYEGTDAPDTTEMIWISLQLKTMYPGFLITTPPAPWSTVDQTFCTQMVQAGALDYAAPQYYDGPNLATQAYITPSIDTWSGLLGESHLMVGFGVADATNYMTVPQVIATWNAVIAKHPALRGAFDWQVDVDQAAGWPFAIQVGALVNP